jgi:glycogen debranching enzyme
MDEINYSHQQNQCICCNSTNIKVEPTLTSLFLSRSAWNGTPEYTDLLYCTECGFRTYRRNLSTSEAMQYYSNYRNINYIKQRSKDEIFYTKKQFNADAAWMTSPLRQQAFLDMINSAIPEFSNSQILDYGGGDGQLIANIMCQSKYVFDFSNIKTLPGINKIADQEELHRTAWDLIVCAQTMEHVSRPQLLMEELKSLTSTRGHIYIDVPSQQWKSCVLQGYVRKLILAKAKKYYYFHKFLDLYSTAFRVKFEILPPFGFVPMREHVNFFTLDSIIRLGQKSSLRAEHYREDPLCGIQVLFRKQ